jgi:putative acetyltransferase
MVIRAETERDYAAIARVNRLAFGGEGEARLVDALRKSGDVRLSLVGEIDGEIVGHILFSELSIITGRGELPALALAPMAVTPDRQRCGIGSELVQRGLQDSRRIGYGVVLVVGHPEFYPRFGFSAELARALQSPFSGDAWMAAELFPGALAGASGSVIYPAPFGLRTIGHACHDS